METTAFPARDPGATNEPVAPAAPVAPASAPAGLRQFSFARAGVACRVAALVRSPRSLVLVCLAWLVASGAHWDLVQTFAWTRMFVNFARVVPVDDALRRTFSGEELCSICKIVQTATQTNGEETPLAGARTPQKFLLLVPSAPAVVIAAPPARSCATTGEPSVIGRARPEPALPPPRAA